VCPDGFERAAAIKPGSNLGKAPLGVIEPSEARLEWHDARRPHHEADAIIYELHVRGFTQHASSGVSDDARGTYAGVVEKIPYLRELGITVVEFMPVFQKDPQAGDYWGYMPMSLFAADRGYAPAGTTAIDSFRAMVAALHAADIEVVIDVVFNHTAEGGSEGPTYRESTTARTT
jgi:glycogen operon protein